MGLFNALIDLFRAKRAVALLDETAKVDDPLVLRARETKITANLEVANTELGEVREVVAGQRAAIKDGEEILKDIEARKKKGYPNEYARSHADSTLGRYGTQWHPQFDRDRGHFDEVGQRVHEAYKRLKDVRPKLNAIRSHVGDAEAGVTNGLSLDASKIDKISRDHAKLDADHGALSGSAEKVLRELYGKNWRSFDIPRGDLPQYVHDEVTSAFFGTDKV